MTPRTKRLLILVAVCASTLLVYSHYQQQRRLAERQEAHIVDLLCAGAENHQREFETHPFDWNEMRRASRWETIEIIARDYHVPHPTNAYVFLEKPVIVPGYAKREVWLIRKEALNHSEMRQGRWAIAQTDTYPVRFWIPEAALPPALVKQLSPQ